MARIGRQLYRRVSDRAEHRCEYCKLPQAAEVMDLTIDHVIPRAEGGPTSLSNSALACLWCNAHKWKSTKALDPRTGRWVRLFHPRRDRWEDHFKWAPEDLARIEGRTATGRATVDLLEMNSGRALAIRRWLMRIGLHPP